MTRLDFASLMVGLFGVGSVMVNGGQALIDGRSPSGPGYSAEPEPVPVSALTGEYPYRGGAR